MHEWDHQGRYGSQRIALVVRQGFRLPPQSNPRTGLPLIPGMQTRQEAPSLIVLRSRTLVIVEEVAG